MSEELCILNNFPQEFLEEVKKYWDENNASMIERTWGGRRLVGDTITRKDMKDFTPVDDYLFEKFKTVFDSQYTVKESLGYLFYAANSGHFLHHYDIGRTCAINMPVYVDHENSFFYTGDNGEELTDKEWHDVYCGRKEFEFRPENYKFYNLRKPVLCDTSKPHNFVNWSNSDRILFSINFNTTANELKNTLPPEWF